MTDKGFYVEPKTNCPHLNDHIQVTGPQIAKNAPCKVCENEEENWCCLTCAARFCSRYVKGHMAEHYNQSKHAIAVSYSDLSFWCYECDSYITHKSLRPLLNSLSDEKFGDPIIEQHFPTIQSAHGLKANSNWELPTLATKCNLVARDDITKAVIRAHEYLDSEHVLEEKMQLLAELIKQSKYMVVYSGAGISKSSGIPDYATKSENSVANTQNKVEDILDAAPTHAHCVLKQMYDAEYLKYWIQQNHDGLPQKAGYPQEKINEIHGGWFDPSNRVISFSENLRQDLFVDLIRVEKETDLCLCLGTSLSGMNSDRVAFTPATKFKKAIAKQKKKKENDDKKRCLGTVIINLQKTSLDESSTLRVWAKLDDAFRVLSKYLDLNSENHNSNSNNDGKSGSRSNVLSYPPSTLPFGDAEMFVLPYNENGEYDSTKRMVLSLTEGSRIKIVNPFAKNANAIGVVFGKRHDKSWTTRLLEPSLVTYRDFAFGWWWIDSALRGATRSIPFVNDPPTFVDSNTEIGPLLQ